MLSRLSSIRFNPRTPCGVRLVNGNGNNGQDVFQSTHSLRSATRYARSYPSYLSVSIHALLAECDPYLGILWLLDLIGFNPRTPCGVRPGEIGQGWKAFEFQSTHSLRSATQSYREINYNLRVSIHALLAECDLLFFLVQPGSPVSIHALLAECDQGSSLMITVLTVSIHALLAECDGETVSRGVPVPVSIHALLAECDLMSQPKPADDNRFNPRTPCGVRRLHIHSSRRILLFQSTHSLRSATWGRPRPRRRRGFQSTHSLRSATQKVALIPEDCPVSIHALLAECD